MTITIINVIIIVVIIVSIVIIIITSIVIRYYYYYHYQYYYFTYCCHHHCYFWPLGCELRAVDLRKNVVLPDNSKANNSICAVLGYTIQQSRQSMRKAHSMRDKKMLPARFHFTPNVPNSLLPKKLRTEVLQLESCQCTALSKYTIFCLYCLYCARRICHFTLIKGAW